MIQSSALRLRLCLCHFKISSDTPALTLFLHFNNYGQCLSLCIGDSFTRTEKMFLYFCNINFCQNRKRGFLPLSLLPGLNFEMSHTIHNTKIDIHAFLTSYMDDFKCISLNPTIFNIIRWVTGLMGRTTH